MSGYTWPRRRDFDGFGMKNGFGSSPRINSPGAGLGFGRGGALGGGGGGRKGGKGRGVGNNGEGRLRPNVFLAIYVDNREVITGIQEVQDECVRRQPRLESHRDAAPSYNCHVSLLAARVPWEARARAIQLVERTLADSILPSLLGQNLKLEIQGLGSFGEKIVFADIRHGRDQLIAMNAVFREAFESEGYECDARFTPHITILKATNDREGVSRSTYADLRDCRFGEQEVTSLSLVSMDRGHHKTLRSFNFIERASPRTVASPLASPRISPRTTPTGSPLASPIPPRASERRQQLLTIPVQEPQPQPPQASEPSQVLAIQPPSLPAPEVTCPVCLENVCPPMRLVQCGAGHILCDSCYSQVSRMTQEAKCPTCRQPITGRPCQLESLLGLV